MMCTFIRKLASCKGQSTVEYALVLAAFLAVVIGLGALAHLFSDGAFAQHAAFSASHHVSGNAPGAILDIFSF